MGDNICMSGVSSVSSASDFAFESPLDRVNLRNSLQGKLDQGFESKGQPRFRLKSKLKKKGSSLIPSSLKRHISAVASENAGENFNNGKITNGLRNSGVQGVDARNSTAFEPT